MDSNICINVILNNMTKDSPHKESLHSMPITLLIALILKLNFKQKKNVKYIFRIIKNSNQSA